MSHNLWNANWTTPPDELAAKLNDSLPYDQRMAQVDVQGSIAWVHALAEAELISCAEAGALEKGLKAILAEFESGSFEFKPGDEDIHTAVERRLGELSGAVGGKLHTGRSRNDQVATDFRLWMVDACGKMESLVDQLQTVLLKRAEQDAGVMLPGYTHFQQAQPILLSHWWLSHFWALQRDRERLVQVRRSAASSSPLGSGALAGTGFAAIDRFALASELGFAGPAPNSLDAVSDRDFAAEFLFWAALTAAHLSRLAEALILYSTREFGFITHSDAYSTGSSLMPQKRNPDPLELVRARAAGLNGRLAGWLGTLKGLPSAYDKDLQEDKPAVFEAADTLALLLPVVGGAIQTLTVHPQKTAAAMDSNMLATDVADALVEKGVPFRQAHAFAAAAVRKAAAAGVSLHQLSAEDWQSIHPALDGNFASSFSFEQSIARRGVWGGTAPQAVALQLCHAYEVKDSGYGWIKELQSLLTKSCE